MKTRLDSTMARGQRRGVRVFGLGAVAFSLSFFLGAPAAADGPPTLYFLITDVELPDAAPPKLSTQIAGTLQRAITKHPRLVAALPDGAPDPKTHANDASGYIQKHGLKAYRIDVEVVSYSVDVEPMAKPKLGHTITASLSLRLFGEDLHKRVIGFTGEGVSTIKAEVGKKVRERDKKFAVSDAIELAIADALTVSVKRLDSKGVKNKRRAKKRRAKKRSKKKSHRKKN